MRHTQHCTLRFHLLILRALKAGAAFLYCYVN